MHLQRDAATQHHVPWPCSYPGCLCPHTRPRRSRRGGTGLWVALAELVPATSWAEGSTILFGMPLATVWFLLENLAAIRLVYSMVSVGIQVSQLQNYRNLHFPICTSSVPAPHWHAPMSVVLCLLNFVYMFSGCLVSIGNGSDFHAAGGS